MSRHRRQRNHRFNKALGGVSEKDLNQALTHYDRTGHFQRWVLKDPLLHIKAKSCRQTITVRSSPMPKRKNRPDKSKDVSNEPAQIFVSPEDRERFKNTAKALSPEEYERLNFYGPGRYKFDRTPQLLIHWGRLFQAVISQAGTKLLTGKYHTTECAIYKTEGGCRIAGFNDLVLRSNSCSWDYGGDNKDTLAKMVDLISHVVLKWDPCDPINTILSSAAEAIGDSVENLKAAVEASSAGGVFGGNPLSYFFDRNPFDNRDDPLLDEYLRFCKIHIKGEDPKDVDQFFADKKLGKELYEKLSAKVKSNKKNGYTSVYSCSPSRINNKLSFWVNTGRTTNLDGWRTQEEIEKFLKGDGLVIEDRRR